MTDTSEPARPVARGPWRQHSDPNLVRVLEPGEQLLAVSDNRLMWPEPCDGFAVTTHRLLAFNWAELATTGVRYEFSRPGTAGLQFWPTTGVLAVSRVKGLFQIAQLAPEQYQDVQPTLQYYWGCQLMHTPPASAWTGRRIILVTLACLAAAVQVAAIVFGLWVLFT